MYTLIICIGILWGNQCQKVLMADYPTKEVCEANAKHITPKIKDGFAVCIKKDK